MRLFERLRQVLATFDEGVHELGDPASKASLVAAAAQLGAPLPDELRDLLLSWDGLALFADTAAIFPLDQLRLEAHIWTVGTLDGAPVMLGPDGRLFHRDESGERQGLASSIERWLLAVLQRESLLIGRDGEWRDVFEGGGLRDDVRRKRSRAGLKVDPDAAALLFEAAELDVEEGRNAEALAALARATEVDPEGAAAWELLGALERRGGRAAAGQIAYERAAAVGAPGRRARRLAEAARCAREAGDEVARARLGAAARAVQENLALVLAAAAKQQLDDGDPEGATNLAGLSLVVEPEGPAAEVARAARLKTLLRTAPDPPTPKAARPAARPNAPAKVRRARPRRRGPGPRR